MKFLALLYALLVTGCDDECERSGYEALRVRLVSAVPAAPVMGAGCSVFTDLPTDTRDPDQYGDALRHIGQSVYQCLTGVAEAGEGGAAFYDERLWFRIDGQVPQRGDGQFYYGYWNGACNTIDTSLAHIGPQQECIGVAQAHWPHTCWTQFYKVIGHEVAHGWLGSFHRKDYGGVPESAAREA